MAFLEVKDIYKNFGETQVLKGVSFDMEKGEVFSIIGSSGNGKTTLLRCLNFLEVADGGKITVDGEQIFPIDAEGKKRAKVDKKRLTFGMVFQNFNLFPQYTALKNITLAMDVRSDNLLKAQNVKGAEKKRLLKEAKEKNEETAKQILTRVGLENKMGNYPCELSGGQQQRVAIARALALSPDILCFDEPTSALDPELTGEVLKVIKQLRDEGRTMIIVTHEMEFAKNVSDKIIFMADGVIEEMGTPAQIFDAPQSEKTRAFLSRSNEQEAGYDA
ncbi:MAG: amino acid ABC transporter ATP-binding protein [Clostridia bacterium]|nr:amino acid ABC transporter ATP-binding protein [Clostridia bacterium]